MGNFASMLVLLYNWICIRLLVERTINGWFLERRVVRYSDLFEHRVHVRWFGIMVMALVVSGRG